jgi:hypothetical protein
MSLRSSRLGFKSRPGRSVFAQNTYLGTQTKINARLELSESIAHPYGLCLGLSTRRKVDVETVAKGF